MIAQCLVPSLDRSLGEALQSVHESVRKQAHKPMLTHFLHYLIILLSSGHFCPQLLFKMPYLETGNRILLGSLV